MGMSGSLNPSGGAPIGSKTATVSVGASGALYSLRAPLKGMVTWTKVSGHANLSVSGSKIALAAAIASGTSQTIIVRGSNGSSAVEFQVTIKSPSGGLAPAPESALPKWAAALTSTRAGTSRSVIGVIGDSIPAGAFSGTPNTAAYAVNTRSGSWPHRLQEVFKSDLLLPDAGKNIFGNGSASAGGSTQADMLAANSELLFSGTSWNQYSSVKNLGGWVLSSNVVDTSEVGFANSEAYDTVEVFWPTNSTLTGTLLPQIGGLQVGTISPSVAPSVKSQKFTGTPGAGGVRMRRGGSGRAYFVGMAAYKAADKSVAVYNAGWAGSQTSDWTNNPTGLDAFDGVATLGAASNLVLIALGTNDINNSIAQATFLANMNALYNKAKTATNDVLFIIPHYMNSTLKSFAIQDGYWTAFKTQCDANGQKYFDCKTIPGFATYAAAVAAGYMGDAAVHLSAAGSAAIATAIYSYLRAA